MHDKTSLRAHARERRATISAGEREAWSEAICAHLVHHLKHLPPKTVIAFYVASASECDILPALRKLAARFSVALPSVAARAAPLVFRRWQPGDALVPAAFSTREPLTSAEALAPDIILVPLLAFDAEGHRLGYGGGYYDRTLELHDTALAIGIAFACQEVAKLPREPHDARLSAVITENGVPREWR